MDDSRDRFWEKLIVDWVAVAVLAFLLQGLWFGLGALLASWNPGWETGFRDASRSFLVLWALAFGGGLAFGYYRALKARNAPAGRR